MAAAAILLEDIDAEQEDIDLVAERLAEAIDMLALANPVNSDTEESDTKSGDIGENETKDNSNPDESDETKANSETKNNEETNNDGKTNENTNNTANGKDNANNSSNSPKTGDTNAILAPFILLSFSVIGFIILIKVKKH